MINDIYLFLLYCLEAYTHHSDYYSFSLFDFFSFYSNNLFAFYEMSKNDVDFRIIQKLLENKKRRARRGHP
jgi:hypothetical protein